MDCETRKEWEHYCAMAEIVADVDEFVEIRRNIFRILEMTELQVRRLRPRSTKWKPPEAKDRHGEIDVWKEGSEVPKNSPPQDQENHNMKNPLSRS